jgi:hypothetical protein
MSRPARARQLYAAQVRAQGPAWRNAADNIVAGYTNAWIAAGIAAIEAVLRLVPEGED